MSRPFNPIMEKSFAFSLHIIELAEHLEGKKKFVISRQILKSGTSVGANIREAQGAESRADFQHKMKIAFKEGVETEYWLDLCDQSKNYPTTTNLKEELQEIMKLLSSIISTSKKRN